MIVQDEDADRLSGLITGRLIAHWAWNLTFASIPNPQVTALQHATDSRTDSTTGFNLLAEAAGQPIDPETLTPAPRRDYVARRTGLAAPEHMTEGAPAGFEPFESGYDPDSRVDQAIMATRNAVFPLHGLMPL